MSAEAPLYSGSGRRAGQALTRPPATFEAEVVPGLEPFAADELAMAGARLAGPATAGWLRFTYGGRWRRLLELRSVVAVYAVVASGLARPTALLDDGRFKRIVAAVGHLRSLHPSGQFGTFRISAAGVDSAPFRRFAERLTRETGLVEAFEGGDLLTRFKRGPDRFELAVRLTPRPLSARAWRVCNLPGALNATVASVMARLTEPKPDDVYLNLACGSATLLVERAALGPAARLIGCDIDEGALACAARNVEAAGYPVELYGWDARAVPLPDASASALVADLPFGQLVGSHRANAEVYPAVLAEAARLARPGARFVAITQQVNLFERSLCSLAGRWSLERTARTLLPSNAGPIRPRIYVVRRLG